MTPLNPRHEAVDAPGMRRIDLTRHSRNSSRNSIWRTGAVRLALALSGTALMTAIAWAEIGGGASASVDGLMKTAIARQRVAAGQGVQLAADEKNPTKNPTMTRDQILASAESYESDIKQAIMHADELRLQAYRSKDLIRMNYIASKLDDMREIQSIAEPALASIRQPNQELFTMLAKLNTIRQGWERVKQASADVEAAASDTGDPTMDAFAAVNAQTNPSEGVTDPTGPGAPTNEVERPVPASAFR
jgi:hypothetical protein